MVLPSVLLLMLLLFGAIGIALEAVSDYQQLATASVLLGRGDVIQNSTRFLVSTSPGMVCVTNEASFLASKEVCAIDYR